MRAVEEPEAQELRLGAIGTLLLLALVLLARLLAIRVCHLYDDAFITYRYAENLAHGKGLVFHPGAPWEPVLGTTTPGYAVWLAGWIRLGVDAVRASLATNVACDLASAFVLLRVLGGRPLVAALAVAGFACSPELARVSAGGMEAPVFLLLVLLASSAWQRGRSSSAGVLAALACAVRPEAGLLAVAFGLESLGRKARWRTLAPMLVTGGLIVLALTLYYGSPLPQSVLAKASRHGGASTLSTLLEILAQAFLPNRFYALALPFVAIGMLRGVRGTMPFAPFMRFALAMVASYLVARPHTWGWYYYVPLTSWMLALALGVEWVWRRLPWRQGRERLEVAAPATIAVLGMAAALLGARGRTDRVTERVYEPLRAWTREARLAESGARVLASDIGALGYYGRGAILDTEGLVWPEAARARGAQLELVREHRPEYLMITAARAKLAPLRVDADFAREYVPIRRFSATGATALDPPLDALADHWVQDYIVYERSE